LATSTNQVIEGQYLRDILDQPQALDATLHQLVVSTELVSIAGQLRDGAFQRVFLTGMGASFYALHPLFLWLNACRYTTLSAETSELVHSLSSWFDPQTLIIAVSQSGQSAEIVRLLEENRGRATIIGVTNVPDSALARGGNALLLTKAGKESSVSCKTYLTSVLALRLLGGLLCGQDPARTREELSQAATAVASYLREWKDRVQEMAKELDRAHDIFLLARGASLAAAGEGALIIKESVRMHAEAMSGAAFRHGPLEMVSKQTFAIIFSGADATRALQAKLRDDIRQAGGCTAWIAHSPQPGPWNLPVTTASASPIVEILPVQMMTLAIAANAGVEAGRFTRIPKITATE